mmetsp:Transcript_15827/g.23358  ORF Transcript_15827/g.23358 Transcript_15827/m.23358 type:complete len:97 (-) Transcript_15827:82-372(-)
MCTSRAKSNRDTLGNICAGKIGHLADAEGPAGNAPYNTDHQLSCGDEPMGMNHVGGILVVDVVKGISCIPGNYQQGQFRGRTFFCFTHDDAKSNYQ